MMRTFEGKKYTYMEIKKEQPVSIKKTKIANSTFVSFKCPSNLLSGELRMQSVLLHINYEHFTTNTPIHTLAYTQTHTTTDTALL